MYVGTLRPPHPVCIGAVIVRISLGKQLQRIFKNDGQKRFRLMFPIGIIAGVAIRFRISISSMQWRKQRGDVHIHTANRDRQCRPRRHARNDNDDLTRSSRRRRW